MPGYDILDSQLKTNTTDSTAKYRCPRCRLLLRDAVQPSCGHWLCNDCATEIFKEKSPRCPRDDCGEELVPDDGQDFFPDRFVRREILAFMVICAFSALGCTWEGQLADYEKHREECKFAEERCICGKTMPRTELALHKKTICPKSRKLCPLSGLGCSNLKEMTNEEMSVHFRETNDIIDHFEILSNFVRQMKIETVSIGSTDAQSAIAAAVASSASATGKRLPAIGSEFGLDSGIKSFGSRAFDEEKDGGGANDNGPTRPRKLDIVTKTAPMAREMDFDRMPLYAAETLGAGVPLPKHIQDQFDKARRESKKENQKELEAMSNKVKSLEQQVQQLNKTIQTKTSEIEDRDFRLSLIENSNYDGTMIWKIPQFSQRMTDAKTGKYTSIFSLPFYSGRYGYKMCLRLYIMGDGIGKGSHMSLFFVMMRGEFDNILQWPFTQRVTFRLINQGSGRDIVDTFQPDPLSSSFKKPKSDMNIASGCPRFIAHDTLKSGGYIADDTVFIKCVVDRTSMSHP